MPITVNRTEQWLVSIVEPVMLKAAPQSPGLLYDTPILN